MYAENYFFYDFPFAFCSLIRNFAPRKTKRNIKYLVHYEYE